MNLFNKKDVNMDDVNINNLVEYKEQLNNIREEMSNNFKDKSPIEFNLFIDKCYDLADYLIQSISGAIVFDKVKYEELRDESGSFVFSMFDDLKEYYVGDLSVSDLINQANDLRAHMTGIACSVIKSSTKNKGLMSVF